MIVFHEFKDPVEEYEGSLLVSRLFFSVQFIAWDILSDSGIDNGKDFLAWLTGGQ